VLIEQAIKNRLISDTTLVGSNIHYDKATQAVVAPYIVLQKISEPTEYGYSGTALVDSRIQFSIFASTWTSCKAIAAEINTAFSGYAGTMGGVGGVYVSRCFRDDETDLPFDEATKLYGLALDFKLLHA